MAIHVEGLEVSIKTNSQKASDSLNALVSSMKKIGQTSPQSQSALKKFNDELKRTAEFSSAFKNGISIKAPKVESKGIKNIRTEVANVKEDLIELQDVEETVSDAELSKVKESTSGVIQRFRELAKSAIESAKGFNLQKSEISTLRYQLKDYKSKIIEATKAGDEEKVMRYSRAYNRLEKNLKSAKREMLSFGKISDAISKAKSVAFYRVLRSAIKTVADAFRDGFENAYRFSQAVGGELVEKMDALASITKQMKNQFGSAFSELAIAVKPVLDSIVSYAIKVADTISQIFAYINGDTKYKKANPLSESWKEATASAKQYKDLVLGIDELNILNESSGGAGGKKQEDYASMFEYADIDEGAKWRKTVDWIKEHFDGILTTVKLIGSAMLLWKVSKGVATLVDDLMTLPKALKTAGGLLMSFAGFSIEFLGAESIGKNGFNWANTLATIIGSGIGIAGATVAFGTTGLILSIPVAIGVFIAGYKKGIKKAGLEAYNNSEFKKELDDLKARIEKGAEITFDIKASLDFGKGRLKEIEADALKAKVAINRIFELNENSKKTIAEFDEFTGLIDYVNNLGIENLHLDLDPNGKLTDTKDNINEIVHSLLVAQIRATAIEELTNAEFELARATQNSATRYSELDEAIRKSAEAEHELTEAKEQLKILTDNHLGLSESARKLAVKIDMLERATRDADEATQTANENFIKAKEVEKEAGETLDFYRSVLSDVEGYASNIIDPIDGMTSAFARQTDQINTEIESVQRLAEELAKVTSTSISVSVENAKKKFGGGFAEGGFPETGQLFLAREAGAEMVGSMGGHTAVANNDQIVQGIESGVYSAVANALSPLLSQIERNTRESASKDLTVRIGDRDIAKANNRGQKLIGATIVS